jgi:hypothetical protein
VHRLATDERQRFILLLEKLDKLNSAVHAIANMRDLHIRIISEALGRIAFKVTRKNGKMVETRILSDVLEHRHEIKEIEALDQQHLTVLQEIAGKLKKSATTNTKLFLTYRNQLVHEEPQSVDDPNMFPQLQSRDLKPIIRDGIVIGHRKGMFSRKERPDWYFEDLFAVVVDVFEHYLGTLRSLKALDEFKP